MFCFEKKKNLRGCNLVLELISLGRGVVLFIKIAKNLSWTLKSFTVKFGSLHTQTDILLLLYKYISHSTLGNVHKTQNPKAIKHFFNLCCCKKKSWNAKIMEISFLPSHEFVLNILQCIHRSTIAGTYKV